MPGAGCRRDDADAGEATARDLRGAGVSSRLLQVHLAAREVPDPEAGLLAFAAMFVVSGLLEQLPLIPNPPGWYLGTMLLSLACIVAPALWGFWISQAGRPLFGDEILGPAVRR